MFDNWVGTSWLQLLIYTSRAKLFPVLYQGTQPGGQLTHKRS